MQSDWPFIPQVSDVSDDVRRAAVMSLGFLLFRCVFHMLSVLERMNYVFFYCFTKFKTTKNNKPCGFKYYN